MTMTPDQGPARPAPPRRRRRKEERAFAFSWRMGVVLVFLLLLAGTLAGVVSYHLDLFSPRVTRENFEQLTLGMKESEVRRLLGSPSRIENTGMPRFVTPRAQAMIQPQNYPRTFYWVDGEDVIWVEIDRGRVRKWGATLDGERLGSEAEDSQESP